MTKEAFNSILKEILKNKGFIMKKNIFHYRDERLIIVVDTQKSNYSEEIYINFGFLVRKIHTNCEYPKICECDFSGRFRTSDSKAIFDYSAIIEEEFERVIEKNYKENIAPVIENGIESFFEKHPTAINAAKLSLKDYLRIEHREDGSADKF